MPTVLDATVVASAYDTSGNGGRKLVNFPSDVQFAVEKNATSIFIQKRSGGTWADFATVSYTTVQDVALVRLNDTTLGVIISVNNVATTFRAYRVSDAFLVQSVSPDTAQTAMGNVSLISNDTGTELHATWASKNATYANSFNLRYAKGTINADGSVAWGAVEQRTTHNTAGTDAKNPSIVVKDNTPIIVFELNSGGGSTFTIHSLVYNGTSWTTNTVYTVVAQVQASPSAIFVPQSVNGLANGRIWVVWKGNSSTYGQYNIAVSYSDDGGVTWSAITWITTNSTNGHDVPIITANKNNEIFVLCNGYDTAISASYIQVRQLKYSNGSWGGIETLTNATTAHQAYPSSLFDPTFQLNFTEPLFIYKDSQNAKVGFYGTWTVTTISVTQGSIGQKTDKANLLEYAITTDGVMSMVTEKVNGVTVGTKTATSGQSQIVGLTQEQWDEIAFGKYRNYRNLVPAYTDANYNSIGSNSSKDNAWVNGKLEIYNGSANVWGRGIVLDLIPNKPYTLSFDSSNATDGAYPKFAIGYSPDGYEISATALTGFTFTPTQSKVYFKFLRHGDTALTDPAKMWNIQLTEGTTVQPFKNPSELENTLTIEMGTEKFTYTFDKRPATNADMISVAKAVQDSANVSTPAKKSLLASAIRAKGGTVSDGDALEVMASALTELPNAKVARGSFTVGSSITTTINNLTFTPDFVTIHINTLTTPSALTILDGTGSIFQKSDVAYSSTGSTLSIVARTSATGNPDIITNGFKHYSYIAGTYNFIAVKE